MSEWKRNQTIVGNVVAKPERAQINGKNVAKFRLAEPSRQRNQETSEWEDGPTTFYNVVVPEDRGAAHAVRSLDKGNRVVVLGSTRDEPFVKKDGTAEISHDLWAAEVAASTLWADLSISARATRSVEPPSPSAGFGM